MATQETVQIIQFADIDQIPASVMHLIGEISVGTAIAIALALAVLFAFRIAFCLSCYRTLKCVPANYRQVPAGLCWLFLVPVVGYVFEWIIMPFALPTSIKRYKDNDVAVATRTRTLFGVGLAFVIMPLVTWVPVVNVLGWLANLVLWIIYWVNVIRIRDEISVSR